MEGPWEQRALAKAAEGTGTLRLRTMCIPAGGFMGTEASALEAAQV